jgi:hypothetical protein
MKRMMDLRRMILRMNLRMIWRMMSIEDLIVLHTLSLCLRVSFNARTCTAKRRDTCAFQTYRHEAQSTSQTLLLSPA